MKRKQKEKIKYDITNEVVQQKYNNIKYYVICINKQIDMLYVQIDRQIRFDLNLKRKF